MSEYTDRSPVEEQLRRITAATVTATPEQCAAIVEGRVPAREQHIDIVFPPPEYGDLL